MTQWGIGPVGTIFAGAAIEVVGPQPTLAAMGAAVIVLAFVLFWRAPSLWNYSVERKPAR